MNKPKVSVCMIAYNHEAFINKAVQGVLDQKTNFAIELIISNDASTDQTNEVISNIVNNSENISIKYFNHIQNKGMIPNFIFTLEECKGDFIALCEGDDYWIDPLKLQKQVDFLESNPDFSLVSGGIQEYYQGTNRYIEKTNQNDIVFTYKDLLSSSKCSTCTILFRNNLPKQFPDIFFKERGADRQLCLLVLGLNQKGFVSKDIYAVYRRHNNSITQKVKNISTKEKLEIIFGHIRIAKDWSKFYGNKNNKVVRKVKVKRLKQMIRLIIKNNEYIYIFSILKKMFY